MMFIKSTKTKLIQILIDIQIWFETLYLAASFNVFLLTEKLVSYDRCRFILFLKFKRYTILHSERILNKSLCIISIWIIGLSLALFNRAEPVTRFLIGKARNAILIESVNIMVIDLYRKLIIKLLPDAYFTVWDFSNTVWFVYNNAWELFQINKHHFLNNLEIINLAFWSSVIFIKNKTKVDLIPVIKVLKSKWYWKIVFFSLLFITSTLVVYQLLFSIIAAIFFFFMYTFCVINEWERVIEYKPELPQLHHMTWYTIYQLYIAQPVARGFMANYYFVKIVYLIKQIYNKEITLSILWQGDNQFNCVNNPLTQYDYLCKRGRKIHKLAMLFSIIPITLIIVFIKWKLVLYTGFSYLAIILAAEISAALSNNIKELNSINDLNKYIWHVEYELYGSGSWFTHLVAKLRIILKYEVTYTNPTTNTNNANVLTKNNLENVLYAQAALDELDNIQLLKEEGVISSNEPIMAFDTDIDDGSEPIYKFIVIFNPKLGNHFYMLKNPTHFYQFYKLFTQPNKIWKPADIYIGDKSTYHRGLYTEIDGKLLVNNMTKQRIINYLKLNNSTNQYSWNSLFLNKSNSPGYDPRVTQQFWPLIHTVSKEYIKDIHNTLIYPNNRIVYQDSVTINTLELVFKLSNYFNTSDNVIVYFRINEGDRGLIYDLQYFSKTKNISPELQHLVNALNDFVKQYSDVFNNPNLKKEFESDLKEFIEINSSFKYYDNNLKNSKKNTFNVYYGDEDPIKH